MSFREIGQIVHRSHSSIQYVVNTYKNTGFLVSKPRSGRPPKLTPHETRSLLRSVKVNPRLSASVLVKNIESKYQKSISADAVRKI